jgi:hypothetical protein
MLGFELLEWYRHLRVRWGLGSQPPDLAAVPMELPPRPVERAGPAGAAA